jgi:hypothetical protein
VTILKSGHAFEGKLLKLKLNEMENKLRIIDKLQREIIEEVFDEVVKGFFEENSIEFSTKISCLFENKIEKLLSILTTLNLTEKLSIHKLKLCLCSTNLQCKLITKYSTI